MSHITFLRVARPGADEQQRANTLFHEMVREDSNLEMDWLWLATIVTREYERVYCLQRALQINPQSFIAARGLAQFPPIHQVPRPFTSDDTTAKGECTQ